MVNHSGFPQTIFQRFNKKFQAYRLMIPDIINLHSHSIFISVRSLFHHCRYAFNDIVNISEITVHISVIKQLDFLALYHLICKSEIRHVRSSARTIYRKETQSRAWNPIQLAICVGKEFIGFFRCRI